MCQPAVDPRGQFSLAVGVESDEYDVSIGVVAQGGRGTALGLSGDIGATFVPRDLRIYSVQLFLNGYKRAAARLARRMVHRIRDRRDDDQEPPREPAPRGEPAPPP